MSEYRALLEHTVSDVDAFGALRYWSLREQMPILMQAEHGLTKTIPNASSALLDCYHCLWSVEPALKPVADVKPGQHGWRTLLEGMLASTDYVQLHVMTQLSELKSAMGAAAMAEIIMRAVPDETRQILHDLADAQETTDAAQADAARAQARANALQQILASAQVVDGLTSDQARALANALAEAQARAEKARDAEMRARAVAEETAQTGLDENTRRDLARIGLLAAKQAVDKVQATDNILQAWGLTEGQLMRDEGNAASALALLERLRGVGLRQLADLLGRLRPLARAQARASAHSRGEPEPTQEFGRDIRRAETRELLALTQPTLRYLALRRWTHDALALRAERNKEQSARGPLLVCEDSSGSMGGEKARWAKALTLTLATFAKEQRRSFGWIMFDYRIQKQNIYPGGELSIRQMLEIAEARSGGGTNFEAPLRCAAEMIEQHGALRHADIVFITDGECAVSDQFIHEFQRLKKRLEFQVIAVLCDVEDTADTAVRQFADRVEHVSRWTTADAEKVMRDL